MSANIASSLASSKASGVAPQLPSPSQSQPPSSLGFDSQRRNATSGNVGSARTGLPTARNNQSLRKQHRSQRRPKLGEEDRTTEMVRDRDPTASVKLRRTELMRRLR